MTLSADDIEAVRVSWSKIVPLSPMAADLFYGRLFTLAPETRPLFRGDMTLQGKKLMDTVNFVVDHLDDRDTLMPAATALAIRHVGYGVSAAHYAPVGEALIWTLDTMLGTAFGSREREAWTAAYDLIAREMVEAAYGRTAV